MIQDLENINDLQLKEADDEEELVKERKKRRKQKDKNQKLRRKGSFSDGLVKYDDWLQLKNPLRDRTGHNAKDMETVNKIRAAGRYPIPELLIGAEIGYDIFIDSIIQHGYNSDDMAKYASKPLEIEAPANSVESLEEIDFESSSSEDEEILPGQKPATKKERAAVKKKLEQGKILKVSKKNITFHGFDIEQL